MEKFDYTQETQKSCDEAVVAKTKGKGFGVLHIHDVKGTLNSKGFDCQPLKIIEICNPKYVSEVLKRDIKVSLILPCPISVYAENGKTYISALRPRIISSSYPEADIQSVADEVDGIVLSIVDEAK